MRARNQLILLARKDDNNDDEDDENACKAETVPALTLKKDNDGNGDNDSYSLSHHGLL